MNKEKAYWFDHKPSDDNDGYIYGIHYLDNDEIVHCEWYKDQDSRDLKIVMEETNEWIRTKN